MAYKKDKKRWNEYMSAYNKKPENRIKQNARKRAYRAKNPEKSRMWSRNYRKRTPEKDVDRRLRGRYGITLIEYNAMVNEQFGLCKICGGESPDDRRLAVDHDHKTGKVRGLLCDGCNRKLGWYEILRDNINKYLS